MNIGLKCELSLSKKLRAILKNGGSIQLTANNIQDGKSFAILSLNNVIKTDLSDILSTETSLIIRPIEIVDQMENIEETESFGEPVSTIFSSKGNHNTSIRTAIDRIAACSAPKNKEERATAIKTKEEIIVPKAFKELRDQSCKDYIDNLSALLEAAKDAEKKDSGIDPDSIVDARKKAVAIEAKEKAEAIDIPSYIVNTSCASLSINDLGLSLILNVPFNLANISAKRLLASTELQSMLRSKLIKFISPNEIAEYISKASVEEIPELEVFGRKEEAENAFERKGASAKELELSDDDLDEISEQERLAKEVGKGNVVNSVSLSGNVRTSSHSLNMPRFKKTIPEEEVKQNKQGIKTIRRA